MKSRMMSGFVVCVVMAYITVVLQARVEKTEKQDLVMTSASASTELRAALGQIVEIHEKQLTFVKNKYTMGRVDYTAVINTKIELSKAKIRLAQNRGEFNKVIDGLRSNLALSEEALRQSANKFRSGEATSEELNATKLELLEAKVALYTAIANQH